MPSLACPRLACLGVCLSTSLSRGSVYGSQWRCPGGPPMEYALCRPAIYRLDGLPATTHQIPHHRPSSLQCNGFPNSPLSRSVKDIPIKRQIAIHHFSTSLPLPPHVSSHQPTSSSEEVPCVNWVTNQENVTHARFRPGSLLS